MAYVHYLAVKRYDSGKMHYLAVKRYDSGKMQLCWMEVSLKRVLSFRSFFVLSVKVFP